MKIDFFATLRLITKQNSITISSVANIKELLDSLTIKYGQEFFDSIFTTDNKIASGIIILVNGENIHFLAGLETSLDQNDIISIFPPLGGG